jgi:16S rRNA G966 N2-methylase RsmD
MSKGEKRRIEKIIVRPNRVRKDMGDIAGLAAAIEAADFMPALLISPFNELIDGQRRLEAAKLLGWKTVPVAVVPTPLIARGEIVANNHKPFTWAEKVAIYRAVKPLIEAEAKQRRDSRLKKGTRTPVGENVPNGKGRTRDLVADYCGDTSGKTLEQAVEVFGSRHEDLKEEIERTGKVNKAWLALRRREDIEPVLSNPVPEQEGLVCGDCREVLPGLDDDSFHAILADPPFGIGFNYNGQKEATNDPDAYWRFLEPIFREIVRVTVPGGLIALWQATEYIPYFKDWFGPDHRLFFACKKFVQLMPTPMNLAVDPIVVLWKPGADPLVPAKAKRRSLNWHASPMQFDPLAKRHPCPRPLDLCEYLILNFVIEGGRILVPFAGSGSIILAASRLSHPWYAVELDPAYCDLASRRLALYGKPGTPCPGQSDLTK